MLTLENPFVGPTVSLVQILNGRDQRVLRQQQWLEQWQTPLISATLVMPGPVKSNAVARYLMAQLAQEVSLLLNSSPLNKAHLILAQQDFSAETGAEMLFAVAMDGSTLKQKLLQLENNHPLGRLWDLDVIDLKGKSISRIAFDQPTRRCLCCEEDARVCGRSRKHRLDELQQAMLQRIRSFYIAKELHSDQKSRIQLLDR